MTEPIGTEAEQSEHRAPTLSPAENSVTSTPATPEACGQDYAAGAATRNAFDAHARRYHGDR